MAPVDARNPHDGHRSRDRRGCSRAHRLERQHGNGPAAAVRRMAEHHRRQRGARGIRPLDQINAVQLQQPEGRLGVAWRERRRHQPRRRGQCARPADLCRRHAHHRLGSAAHGRLARPGHRQDALDVPGADDRTPWSTRCARTTARAWRTARINGRGVVFITTPAFFLHALDAKTGQPLANWGGSVPIPGFPKTGSVDLREGPHRRLGAVAEGRSSRTTRTRASRSSSATSRAPRRPSSSTTSSSSATPPSRATTRRGSRTSRATSWATTRGPESSCGSST